MEKSSLFRSIAASLVLPLAACVGTNIKEQPTDAVDQKSWNGQEIESAAKRDPDVEALGRGVAWLQPVLQTRTKLLVSPLLAGSAVLLDRYGTVAFSNHQTRNIPEKIVLAGFTDPKTGSTHTYETTVDVVDPKLDVAFGTIRDAAFSQALQNGLVYPVKWGNVQRAESEPGFHVFLIGSPGNGKKLHITTAVLKNFAETKTVYDPSPSSLPETVLCKIIVEGRVSDGTSGGLAADGNGKREFFGIINFTNDSEKITGFTPSYALYTIYKNHYPDRALANPFPASAGPLSAFCAEHSIPFVPTLRLSPVDFSLK